MLTVLESRGIMRKPEGRRGASSAKEESIGANISSAHVPTEFSSTPPQSWKVKLTMKDKKKLIEARLLKKKQ